MGSQLNCCQCYPVKRATLPLMDVHEYPRSEDSLMWPEQAMLHILASWKSVVVNERHLAAM